MKFNKLVKLKTITAAIVFAKYLLWSVFFILQGKAIDLAIEKGNVSKQLVYTLFGYVTVKMVVMISDIVQKFLMERYKNIELKEQWNIHFPTNIYNDSQSNKSNINVLFFDYLPRLFELEVSSVINTVVIYCVFTLTLTAFFYTGFFWGILALLFVFVLNFISKNIYVKKIDNCHKETYDNKIKILNWVEQYFYSYREISKNWQGIAGSSWKNEIYNNYFTCKNSQASFYFYRDLIAQLLIELPFLLNTSIVILGVYYSYLSLTQLFVWVGFSQFMINASNAYLENKINKEQIKTINEQVLSILRKFHSKTISDKVNKLLDSPPISVVIMKDGQANNLSLIPSLYHIKGGNGSGKSTLMNIILGYERGRYEFKNSNLTSLLTNIKKEQVRVIDRDTIIFESLTDFNHQICGPIDPKKKWKDAVSCSLSRLLNAKLANEWMKIFVSLESEYVIREDKKISSGEKVILSLMRFFSSWNLDVKLLIIDECDSFLDKEKKNLFVLTVTEISRHLAVYISCHDSSLSKSFESFVFSPKLSLEAY